MVQVDVFWSYAIGAGVAVASARQIQSSQLKNIKTFDTKAFRNTLLFLGLLFAPSGLYLLWAFPSWETMHVAAAGKEVIPAWLATAFGFTNITQGILGFAVAAWLIRKGKLYGAYLQWILGYFCMYFILVHGWDGTGYMRFFSATPDQIAGWSWATAGAWLTSDVAIALYVMGIFFIPALLFLMSVPVKAGFALADDVSPEAAERVGTARMAIGVLFLNVVILPATAVLASVAVRYLGWWLGLPAFAAVIYVIGLRRGGVYHRHFRHWLFADPLLRLGAKKAPQAATA